MFTSTYCRTCQETQKIVVSVQVHGYLVATMACAHHAAFKIETDGRFTPSSEFVCWGCEGLTPVSVLDTPNGTNGLCATCDARVADDRSPVTSVTERTPMSREIASRAASTTPQVDDAKVAAAVRALTGYHIGPKEKYDHPTSYVLAKNGCFEVRESDLCRVIIKAEDVNGIAESLKPGLYLNIPKIPFELLAQTVTFFRAACVKMKGPTEALTQIWWHYDTSTYHIHVPEQVVSGASVRHESKFGQGDDAASWLHVMDIHSHGSMSAFFSGGDDTDERRVNGERLFGVIGNINDPLPSWKFRLRTQRGFIPDIAVSTIFDFADRKFNFHIDGNLLLDVISKPGNKPGFVTLDCPVNPFTDTTFPEAWLDQLKGGGAFFHHQSSGHSPHTTTATGMGGRTDRGHSYGRGSNPAGHVTPGWKRFFYKGHEEMEVCADGVIRKTGNRASIEQ